MWNSTDGESYPQDHGEFDGAMTWNNEFLYDNHRYQSLTDSVPINSSNGSSSTYEQSIFDAGAGLEADTLPPNADFYPFSMTDTHSHTSNSLTSPHVPNPLNKESKICFGAIPERRIKFTNSVIRDQVMALQTTLSFYICSLSFMNDRCELVSSDMADNKLAVLNKKDCALLRQLKVDYKLEFDAVYLLCELESSGKSLEVSIDINVYGTQDMASSLAVALSSASYFLQDPLWIRTDVRYENPQLLKLPDSILDTIEHVEAAEAATPIPNMQEAGQYLTKDGLDFDRILNDFAAQDSLSQASVDTRIRTLLLPYQKEGLDFVLKKESGSAMPGRSLWTQEEDDDTGQTVYRHNITGATSPKPEETLGGILADEMGLGKSLTMLAAIIASLHNASNYASSRNSQPKNNDSLAIAAKSTLVIVPSALLIDNWIAEIEKHFLPGCLSFYKYHGHRRKITRDEIISNDIVLTSYGSVLAERKRSTKLLFEVAWYRIILDEAHIIRNSSTRKFGALRSLQSTFRWCITGTPIQNTIDDLGSLTRFLHMPILGETIQFRRHVTNKVQPPQQDQPSDLRNLRALLKSICLRRDRTVLPNSGFTEEVCEIDLNNEERYEYDRISDRCIRDLDMAVSGQNATKSHTMVLHTILKLRLLCNNGREHQRDWLELMLQDPEDAFAILQQRGETSCYYCHLDDIFSAGPRDDPESAKITGCHKLVCFDCLDYYRDGLKGRTCPICGSEHDESAGVADTTIGRSTYASDAIQNESLMPTYPSKLIRLCENVQKHIHSDKSIVFSFWKKTLDIVCRMFNERNIPYLRLDGNVPFIERKGIISDFQSSKTGTVLLMTLGIGAVGLNNLSVASHVHLLEPQWNPSVEAQAIGRVVRLGQQRSVRIFRYLVNKSIEWAVRDRQIQKLQLSQDGIRESRAEINHRMTLMMKDLMHPKRSANND